MLYIKKSTDDVEMKMDLYEDEIFSSCPICGKEHEVQPDELAHIIQSGDDFSGTSIFCNGCLYHD
ncbi:hypothetical protein [Lentibacillus salicampi]|uniref:Uncharacterized protein n=1 Tax=Lentibacillus salicampi TaxID=175306 RepID=A0A4Y9ACP8_9BACI|nr:hypothetical protein [Lentibacillus salicampi]TFJ92174.1 hypothetical protein E4U82_13935 [Lentibacillus salicampi]